MLSYKPANVHDPKGMNLTDGNPPRPGALRVRARAPARAHAQLPTSATFGLSR
jgi:hypothetical protein